MLCTECGAPEMRRTDEPITETFKGTEVTVHGVGHWVCDRCGETAFSAADLKTYSEAESKAYREIHGLLSPTEIRDVRKSRGLTQREFEDALGVAPPTVCRWETGVVVQTKPMDNLIRGFRDYPCFADDLLQKAEVARRAEGSGRLCVNHRDLLPALSQGRKPNYVYD